MYSLNLIINYRKSGHPLSKKVVMAQSGQPFKRAQTQSKNERSRKLARAGYSEKRQGNQDPTH
jgi:hypothetical protein